MGTLTLRKTPVGLKQQSYEFQPKLSKFVLFHKGMLISSGYPEVTGCIHTKHLCKWPKSKAEQHFIHWHTDGTITTYRLGYSFSLGSWIPCAHTHLQAEPTSTTWRRKWQPTPVFLPGCTVHGVAKNQTWLNTHIQATSTRWWLSDTKWKMGQLKALSS